MIYLVIYLVGWVVFGPLVLATMEHSYDLDMRETTDYFFGAILISCWPLWAIIALVLLPLRILFDYIMIPISNKISKHFK